MNAKSIIIGIVTVVGIAGGVVLLARGDGLFPFDIGLRPTQESQQEQETDSQVEQINASQFRNSYPQHNALLAAPPVRIVINATTQLTEQSRVRVVVDDAQVSGESAVQSTDTIRFTAAAADAGSGTYTVKYTLCETADTCEDGQFGFVVDTQELVEYEDMRGQATVTIAIKDRQFTPVRIVVDAGVTVQWENQDEAIHFVTSDPVESHNLYEPLNSREILTGEQYSVRFDTAGEYGYHDQAHITAGMRGRIVVE